MREKSVGDRSRKINIRKCHKETCILYANLKKRSSS